MSGYSGVVAERCYTSTEIEVIRDIGFPSEVEDVVCESPFHRPDRPGTSGFQVLHYLCYSLFRFSVSGALSDISENVPFFPDDFQAFQRTYHKESRGEQGDVRIIIGPGPMVRSLGQGIGLPHASPRLVVQDKVKASEEQGPASLSPMELFSCSEVLSVLVVSVRATADGGARLAGDPRLNIFTGQLLQIAHLAGDPKRKG